MIAFAYLELILIVVLLTDLQFQTRLNGFQSNVSLLFLQKFTNTDKDSVSKWFIHHSGPNGIVTISAVLSCRRIEIS